MDKRKVQILMPNLNSFEAVQLAVESIHHYTRHTNYEFIVYDDCSINDVDVDYLREAKRRGWITDLIEGQKHIGHGFRSKAWAGSAIWRTSSSARKCLACVTSATS